MFWERLRAHAEASPARVRSEIRSRSNSASEAKMPRTGLPDSCQFSYSRYLLLGSFQERRIIVLRRAAPKQRESFVTSSSGFL